MICLTEIIIERTDTMTGMIGVMTGGTELTTSNCNIWINDWHNRKDKKSGTFEIMTGRTDIMTAMTDKKWMKNEWFEWLK